MELAHSNPFARQVFQLGLYRVVQQLNWIKGRQSSDWRVGCLWSGNNGQVWRRIVDDDAFSASSAMSTSSCVRNHVLILTTACGYSVAKPRKRSFERQLKLDCAFGTVVANSAECLVKCLLERFLQWLRRRLLVVRVSQHG
eukprot:6172414-Pleurochrysis_carterae.AAC.3